MAKKKPKIGIVKFSEVKKNPLMRLDAEYYLGVKEERELWKTVAYIKQHSKSMWRRFKSGLMPYLHERLRVWVWKITGRVKYK